MSCVYAHMYNNKLPIFSVNISLIGSNLEKSSNTGCGNSQRNLWDSPFSMLPGCSIIDLATMGCAKPPTTKLVRSILKLASPITKKIKAQHN